MVCPLLDTGSLGSDRIVGFLPRASERLRRMGRRGEFLAKSSLQRSGLGTDQLDGYDVSWGALPAVELAHSRVRLCALGHGPIWLPSDQSAYSCSQYRAVLLHKSLAVINCFVRIRKKLAAKPQRSFFRSIVWDSSLTSRIGRVGNGTARCSVGVVLPAYHLYLPARSKRRTDTFAAMAEPSLCDLCSIAIFKGNSDDAAGHFDPARYLSLAKVQREGRGVV